MAPSVSRSLYLQVSDLKFCGKSFHLEPVTVVAPIVSPLIQRRRRPLRWIRSNSSLPSTQFNDYNGLGSRKRVIGNGVRGECTPVARGDRELMVMVLLPKQKWINKRLKIFDEQPYK
ncbi:uncharacterized protein LOC116182082, partial [Photinus pyralis]|uniref:uncharacterized protein LOC116182082 n=1 Tax=Photinus pyralis TaxID=7054 RepID=UPI001266FF14